MVSCSESSIACNCAIWGVLLSREGVFRRSLSLFQLHCWLERPSVRLCLWSFCPFPGETFLRRGAIGPAERNIDTTKKITEHVTESYHIDSSIKISKRNDTLGGHAISNSTWNAASPERRSTFSLFTSLKDQSSNSIAWACEHPTLITLGEKAPSEKLQGYPTGNLLK